MRICCTEVAVDPAGLTEVTGVWMVVSIVESAVVVTVRSEVKGETTGWIDVIILSFRLVTTTGLTTVVGTC